MPHRPRQDLAGTIHHAIMRARNREAVFAHDGDRWLYLTLLKQWAASCGCIIHAWALLSNHVHLLVEVTKDHGLARCLQAVNGTYSRQVNRERMRMGNNWQAHAQISPVVFEAYFRACVLYIDCNALKAGLVDDPVTYPWSSCRARCLGFDDGLTGANPWYDSLGATPRERQAVYWSMLTGYAQRMGREMSLGGAVSKHGDKVATHGVG